MCERGHSTVLLVRLVADDKTDSVLVNAYKFLFCICVRQKGDYLYQYAIFLFA